VWKQLHQDSFILLSCKHAVKWCRINWNYGTTIIIGNIHFSISAYSDSWINMNTFSSSNNIMPHNTYYVVMQLRFSTENYCLDYERNLVILNFFFCRLVYIISSNINREKPWINRNSWITILYSIVLEWELIRSWKWTSENLNRSIFSLEPTTVWNSNWKVCSKR